MTATTMGRGTMNWGIAIPLLAATMIVAATARTLYDLYRGWRSWEKDNRDHSGEL